MEAAQHWIDRLRLEPHPEGGYYRETYRAPLMLPHSALPGHGGDRAASTAIYFLLAGDQFSAFHRMRSDELWHFYAGSGLVVHVINPAANTSSFCSAATPQRRRISGCRSRRLLVRLLAALSRTPTHSSAAP